MSNDAYFYVHIVGDDNEIHKLRNQLASNNYKPADYCRAFDLDSIIDSPVGLHDFELGEKIHQAYDWRHENWGCTGNFYDLTDTEIVQAPEELHYKNLTMRWGGVPIKAFKQLFNQFPKLTFHINWYDDGDYNLQNYIQGLAGCMRFWITYYSEDLDKSIGSLGLPTECKFRLLEVHYPEELKTVERMWKHD